MANAVGAIVCDAFRVALAEFYSNAGVTPTLPATFKIGCGGWVSTADGNQPVTPVSTLTTLTAGTGIYTGDSAYVFTKNLVPSTDLSYVSANRRCSIKCFVDTGEGNTTGLGNPPQFFELGVFDAAGVMLAYSTFPMEVKTSDKTLEHYIYIDF